MAVRLGEGIRGALSVFDVAFFAACCGLAT